MSTTTKQTPPTAVPPPSETPESVTKREPLIAGKKVALKHRSAAAAPNETPEPGEKPAPNDTDPITPFDKSAGSTTGTAADLPAELSKSERKEYAKYRRVVHVGVAEMVNRSFEIGRALLQIKEKKLFRKDYGNFSDFCAAELEIAKTRAYELVAAAEVLREFSAMAENFVRPTNERQVRPLTTLKTPEQRANAWDRALTAAGSKVVTEADVRKAVKEIKALAAPAKVIAIQAPTWKSDIAKRLIAGGFQRPFEQPIQWTGDAAHMHSPTSGRYVRLIDRLTLQEAACAKALAQAAPNSLFVANADANAPDGLLFSTSDEIVECFPPEFDLIAKEIGVLVEDDGIFYASGALDSKYHSVWTPLAPEQLADFGLQLVPIKVQAVSKDGGDEPSGPAAADDTDASIEMHQPDAPGAAHQEEPPNPEPKSENPSSKTTKS